MATSAITEPTAAAPTPSALPASPAASRAALRAHYDAVRGWTTRLAAPLESAAFRIQSMPDVSPPWWNLGHTTWFFCRNVLEPYTGDDALPPGFDFVLNSYYESLGPRLARDHRGLVTQPTTDAIRALRTDVDRRVHALIDTVDDARFPAVAERIAIGLQHEQQHQELLVTEIKHILGSNPRELRRPYHALDDASAAPTGENAGAFVPFEAGVHTIGHQGDAWAWDNEYGAHRAYLEPYALFDRLVTNAEYSAFIEDGGYADPLLWLSNGWATVKTQDWQAPLYWRRDEDGRWWQWTLHGDVRVASDEPVAHVSFYEADAYVRWRAANDADWRHARLPTEREWEHGARTAGFAPARGTFLDDGRLHPRPALPPAETGRLRQCAGELWAWTTSHYEPYPRYRPFDGALMEYNGKFMDNQRVLRGGSCATPRNHIRVSYRNFWPADTRFQFTGIRAARDLD
ncbi:MAG: ergothioneine biosynthesis protein EgtB [Acidobacteriota bacterium]